MTIEFPCCVELTKDMTFEMLQEIEKIFLDAGAAKGYEIDEGPPYYWQYYGVSNEVVEGETDVRDNVSSFDYFSEGVTVYTYQELIALSKQTDPVSSTEDNDVENKPEGLSGADFLAEYAKEAEVTDKPWEAFEIWNEENEWETLSKYNSLSVLTDPDFIFRRKPVAGIKIGDYEIFPLTKVPPEGTVFYVPDTQSLKIWTRHFDNSWTHTEAINNGFAHTTRESADNHLKALIEYTQEAIRNASKS